MVKKKSKKGQLDGKRYKLERDRGRICLEKHNFPGITVLDVMNGKFGTLLDNSLWKARLRRPVSCGEASSTGLSSRFGLLLLAKGDGCLTAASQSANGKSDSTVSRKQFFVKQASHVFYSKDEPYSS